MSVLCPKCHRPFTKEILEREPVKVWEHEPECTEEDMHRIRTWPSSVDTSKEVVEFEHRCSCKHCRHVWTETKAVEFDR